jgi:hypothetical protein
MGLKDFSAINEKNRGRRRGRGEKMREEKWR